MRILKILFGGGGEPREPIRVSSGFAEGETVHIVDPSTGNTIYSHKENALGHVMRDSTGNPVAYSDNRFDEAEVERLGVKVERGQNFRK